MNSRPPCSFPLPSLLLVAALAACSSESGVSVDAAVDAHPNDSPVFDIPATDVPTTDVPRTDVPATDVPATDVPTTDVPATDAPATDVPRTDVPTSDVPSMDVPAVDAPPVDAPQPSDACTRPAIERLPMRVDCGPRGGTECPTGYSCLPFSGVVLQQFCGIPCRSDCECPSGERCGSYSDKAGTHPLCVADAVDAL